MAALLRHPWPGNVRELIHMLEQVIVLSDGEVIAVGDLPVAMRGAPPAPPAIDEGDVPTLREVQRRHVLSVLERAGGNRAQAARLLGTSERSFYRLLEKYRRASPGGGSGPKAARSRGDA
jgi:DNA-binding NtrC family response regulator